MRVVSGDLHTVNHKTQAVSGLKAVTSAGTAEALGTGVIKGSLMVKALTTNTGLAYIGNDGANDVASTNGLPLAAGDSVIFAYVNMLSDLYVDVATNGEGVAWIALEIS